jgi:DNA polymerase IV
VVAPSIEAKRYGIETGMTVRDAKLLYPPVIVRTPDPPKYRAVHLMFRRIFRDYSPDVTPKSIDEAVIDLTDTLCLFKGTDFSVLLHFGHLSRQEDGMSLSTALLKPS